MIVLEPRSPSGDRIAVAYHPNLQRVAQDPRRPPPYSAVNCKYIVVYLTENHNLGDSDFLLSRTSINSALIPS